VFPAIADDVIEAILFEVEAQIVKPRPLVHFALL
jgi:hypothetical protein